MARRRMVDPNFWQSEDVAKLSIRQRLLLIGLFSNADDEGKLRGNPSFVRSIVFPYEDFTTSDIEGDLDCIEEIGTIIQYEVNGSKYIKLVNWKKFQRVDKPQASIIPEQVENDSGMIPEQVENDSCLKEVKRKEVKREEKEREEKEREVEENAPAAENPFTFYQNNFGIPSPYITENIKQWAEELSDVAVIEAMKIALEKNVKNWKFISKILNDWHAKGIKTLDTIKAERSEFERQKEANGQARSSPGKNKYAMQDKLPESVQRQLEREQQGKKETSPPTTVMDDPELKAMLDGLRDVQAGVR